MILHLDMDAFFASVEQRDRPELRGRPVLVGGAGRRGVVMAASYEARPFGCRSAQPTAVARRLCPHAIVVRPRGAVYHEVSRQVFAILDCYTPLVEPLSIDEAFLDMAGARRLFGPPVDVAREIRARIRAEVGLTASIGVAPNKFLAKLGSDLDKPDGLTVIDAEWIERELPKLPIGRMWGVGPATESRLETLGVRTFGDLIAMPAEALAARLGSDAERLRRLARGEDRRPVVRGRDARSISHEQTFGENLAEPAAVERVLQGQVERVARRLRHHGLTARTVSVKIRFGDFQTITRSATLETPTDRTDVLWTTARELFRRWSEPGFRPVRLIGAAASQLGSDRGQGGLFTLGEDERRRRVDRLTDEIADRYGSGAIRRGG